MKKRYKLTIDGKKSKLKAIALTPNPAIEVLAEAFNKSERFAKVDETKYQLFAPAMIPDLVIPRIDNQTKEEYEVVFDAQAIEACCKQWMKDGLNSKLNFNHTATGVDAYVFQSFITDNTTGVQYKDYPNGTWIIGVQCLDKEAFDYYKKEGIGFSVEGDFAFEEVFNAIQEDVDGRISNILNKIKKYK